MTKAEPVPKRFNEQLKQKTETEVQLTIIHLANQYFNWD